MKAQEFRICVGYFQEPRQWLTVLGYPLTLKEFPGIQLFVHRPLQNFSEPARQTTKNKWVVSEASTGAMLIDIEYPKVKMAMDKIEVGIRTIPELSPRRFKARIRKAQRAIRRAGL